MLRAAPLPNDVVQLFGIHAHVPGRPAGVQMGLVVVAEVVVATKELQAVLDFGARSTLFDGALEGTATRVGGFVATEMLNAFKAFGAWQAC